MTESHEYSGFFWALRTVTGLRSTGPHTQGHTVQTDTHTIIHSPVGHTHNYANQTDTHTSTQSPDRHTHNYIQSR